MKLIEEDPIVSKIGEVIRVEVGALGTAHMVTYALEDTNMVLHPGQAIKVIVREPVRKQLSLSLAFSESEGGLYEIKVHGGAGDFRSRTVRQLPGQDVVTLLFGLEGDDGEKIPRKPPGMAI